MAIAWPAGASRTQTLCAQTVRRVTASAGEAVVASRPAVASRAPAAVAARVFKVISSVPSVVGALGGGGPVAQVLREDPERHVARHVVLAVVPEAPVAAGRVVVPDVVVGDPAHPRGVGRGAAVDVVPLADAEIGTCLGRLR